MPSSVLALDGLIRATALAAFEALEEPLRAMSRAALMREVPRSAMPLATSAALAGGLVLAPSALARCTALMMLCGGGNSSSATGLYSPSSMRSCGRHVTITCDLTCTSHEHSSSSMRWLR